MRKILALLGLIAVVIIGAAVYLFQNYSNLSIIQAIILIAIAGIVLLASLLIIFLVVRKSTSLKNR